jgi:hypothetical protein
MRLLMNTLPSSAARWYSGSVGISGGTGEHSISTYKN